MVRPLTVLVTGAAGQLGRELVPALEGRGREVVGTTSATMDLTDRDAVVGTITALQPDVVVASAAWTDVDGCEGDPARAHLVNAMGVRHVADGARRVGAHVVLLSTDYVFDGTLDRPYDEWDAPDPQSAYGRSKRGGELELDPGWAIVRTSWLFGRHGSNIVKTILRLAAASPDGELRFVDDQRGCPTEAADLAGVIARLAVGRLPGTFHVTNQGPTTWFELARSV
ncbi:MAG TPA: dTDP-4-dehydrorhamnose reductase, partial [Acidimicrobiales bacterium]|nr:dTDP-4-dehydrorhamnose reductase [Acidimicrobiales bacterium]